MLSGQEKGKGRDRGDSHVAGEENHQGPEGCGARFAHAAGLPYHGSLDAHMKGWPVPTVGNGRSLATEDRFIPGIVTHKGPLRNGVAKGPAVRRGTPVEHDGGTPESDDDVGTRPPPEWG